MSLDHWNFSVFIRILILCLICHGSAIAAPKIDPTLDIYSILRVKKGDPPALIKQAYIKLIRPLYEKVNTGKPEEVEKDEELLKKYNNAYEIFKDPEKLAAYERARRELKTPGERAPSDFTDNPLQAKPFVGELPSGHKSYRMGVASFNHSESISYYRLHPDKNYYLRKDSWGYYRSSPEVTRVQKPYDDYEPGVLDPKWSAWQEKVSSGSPPDLKEIENELEKIRLRCNSDELTSPQVLAQRKSDRAFLVWWFGEQASHDHPELIQKAFDPYLLQPAGVGPSVFAKEVAYASLRQPSWRNSAWVSELLLYPKTTGAVVKAMATPELIASEALVDRLMGDREFNTAQYINYFDYLLPRPESVKYGDRFLRIMATHLKDEYGPYYFLTSGGAMPHWIRERPDLVEYAIRHIDSASSLVDQVVKLVLSLPDSAAHPEWLEYVLKVNGDPDNFIESHLNPLLALDHWYNNPELKRILGGKAFTVENLRQANWMQTAALPSPKSQADQLASCVKAFLITP